MIEIYFSKSLPRFKQYAITRETLESMKPITENCKTEEPIVPCTSPAIPYFVCEKIQGRRVKVCPGPLTINNIATCQHPIILNPYIN